MKQQAFNPFLPLDTYIPDGEPHVFGDRVYLYGSHDKEGGNTFCMLGYEVWSAPVDDLGNWTSSGIVFSPKDTPYYCEERPYLYAPDCVRGNDGRYYLYCCPAGDKGKGGYDGPILVAVSDAPDGKFTYLGEVKHPDGTPFQDCVLFDPAVINDGGVIRLYGGTGLWGGMQITRRNRFVMAKIASAVYHRPTEVFGGENDPLGPFMLVLDDDMMTVRSCTPHILPVPSKTNGFLGHAFFEGASIRKIGDTYYFLYSSERNHELCYATSKYPDRGFVFGGTVVSNGDVGFLGRKQKDRLNHTGTTHGGIEKIGGKWYVFYHRQSHGSDYSRQACAEPIEILEDGSIPQVPISSCGLNGGPLRGEGEYPAVICCHLTNGKMPHGGNRTFKGLPMVTDDGSERFLTNLTCGVLVRYRSFGLLETRSIVLKARGRGRIRVSDGKKTFCTLECSSKSWESVRGPIAGGEENSALEFHIERGFLELLSFTLE